MFILRVARHRKKYESILKEGQDENGVRSSTDGLIFNNFAATDKSALLICSLYI